MILTRRLSPRFLLLVALRLGAPAAVWATTVLTLYAYFEWSLLRVPFLPISTIGTAVAFYVGFKNNSSYDRFWEGRKIWGGIVNASRTWGTAVMSYVLPGRDDPQAQAIRKRLVYRHLAWINALRVQLRKTSRFFHRPARTTKRRLERHAEHMRNDWDQEVGPFLDPEEHARFKTSVNPATHMLTRQGAELRDLVADDGLDLFRQLAMMETVTELYALQGKAERIKNTPFPRQYAEYSRVFTRVFMFLVPLGLLDVFGDHVAQAQGAAENVSLAVPMVLASVLVTWVFGTMEGIGDSTEDPFERSMSDVPMNALCRTIEIDLRQMLGETDLPDKETAIDDVLY